MMFWDIPVSFIPIEIVLMVLYSHYLESGFSMTYLEDVFSMVLGINGILMAWTILMQFPLEKLMSGSLYKNILSYSMGVFLLHQQILYITRRLLNFVVFVFFLGEQIWC